MYVLLVDDHALFRSGMKLLLSDLDPALRFTEAGSLAQALALPPGPIDLLLLDLGMPGADADTALSRVRERFDEATIVVVSGEEDPRVIRRMIESGASGFIPKTSTSPILLNALRLVLAGGVYLPPHVLRDRTAPPAQPAATPVPEAASAAVHKLPGLTERQFEVLLQVVRGKPNKVIAREMGISEGTVKAHLSTAFRVLGVANRTEAVYAAARLGVTAPVAQDPYGA